MGGKGQTWVSKARVSTRGTSGVWGHRGTWGHGLDMGPQAERWGGCSHERASAILCWLPKMVARTFFFPFCYRSSTHAPTERGGRGPQPPAYEGAGNKSQDGIRRGKLKEGNGGGGRVGGEREGCARLDAAHPPLALCSGFILWQGEAGRHRGGIK